MTTADHLNPAERFAVLYVPGRKKQRYAENCVQLAQSHEQAVQLSAEKAHHYPACVYGPSKSSEGTRIYYLVRWLG